MIKMLLKHNKEKRYIVEDFMATRMSKAKFERLKELNPETLGGYEMADKEDIDCTWWYKVEKKLTPKYIRSASFRCDAFGNVIEETY